MKIPLQITFRNFPHSDAIESHIAERATKLEKFNERLVGCRVAVEESQRKQHQGKLYRVHVDMTVPGRELAVTREEHEDIYVAIRDAFDAACRRLEEHARRQRGVVKTHETPSAGRIARIFADDNYGFIETRDNREIYFHRNSLLNEEFSRLKVGTNVVFIEEQGKEGPQAARLTISNQ